MQWAKEYQLFLFDFDGLLVNTEELHFAAYKRMAKKRGVEISWDFPRFCLSAHTSATKLQEDLLAEFPALGSVSWDILYAEKKEAYKQLLLEGKVSLMPGVKEILEFLQTNQIKRCVVTHSPSEQIEAIRLQNPILNTIPYWVTRELYTHPKPHPEAYLKAIALYAEPGDAIIGFEDTPRGLKALMGTRATPVLISHNLSFKEFGTHVLHAASFPAFFISN